MSSSKPNLLLARAESHADHAWMASEEMLDSIVAMAAGGCDHLTDNSAVNGLCKHVFCLVAGEIHLRRAQRAELKLQMEKNDDE
jgi:hypothetical protein